MKLTAKVIIKTLQFMQLCSQFTLVLPFKEFTHSTSATESPAINANNQQVHMQSLQAKKH